MYQFLPLLRTWTSANRSVGRRKRRATLSTVVRLECLEDRALLAVTEFAVIGDFGNNSAAEASVASMVKSWNPNFIVTVGDNNYSTSSGSYDRNVGQYYHEFIGAYWGSYGSGSTPNRFFPALGNHDWDLSNGQEYLSFFTLPGNERYYNFVQGNVDFFIIDSDSREPDGNSSTSRQAQWLQAALAASTSEFNVVAMHHPPYSSGLHGGTTAMRWPFKEWGADVVLTGHDHIYERLAANGLPYFVDGVGGASLTTVSSPTPESQFRYTGHYGAIRAIADVGALTLEFYATDGGGTPVDRFTIGLNAPQPTTQPLIAAGSTWKYLDNGIDQGTAWRSNSFSDGAWRSGPAQLGYGDGDERTVVSYGPSSSNKYTTTYFRRAFTVNNPAQFSGLSLRLLRDDGAVVYLNGQEVYRSNMPSGTVGYGTLATTAVGGADESAWHSASISPSFLQSGTNLLAVEIHQSGPTSSDISFDASLTGTLSTTAQQPALSIDDVMVNEGNSGTTNAVFNVRLSAASSQGVSVAYATANGTASAGSDYSARSGTLLFAAGSTVSAVTVPILGDTVSEVSETFYINLSNPSGATIADSQGRGTIANDDVTTSQQPLIAAGSTWKYLDNGIDQGTAWRSNSFSDGAWRSGPAQLGYGDGDERTVVSYGPSSSNKYTTTYFRRAFTVNNPAQFSGLSLRLLRDDGAVVYLNGQEVYRSNMPSGTVGYGTLATTAVGGADESAWHSASISPSLLQSGTNLLAVEIHQSGPTSSDISFDLSFTGQVGPGAANQLAAGAADLPIVPEPLWPCDDQQQWHTPNRVVANSRTSSAAGQITDGRIGAVQRLAVFRNAAAASAIDRLFATDASIEQLFWNDPSGQLEELVPTEWAQIDGKTIAGQR